MKSTYIVAVCLILSACSIPVPLSKQPLPIAVSQAEFGEPRSFADAGTFEGSVSRVVPSAQRLAQQVSDLNEQPYAAVVQRQPGKVERWQVSVLDAY